MPQALSLGQLTTQLSEHVIAPLYALVGEEDLLRDSALAQIKQTILGAEGDDFNGDVFYGDEAEGAEIASCASEFGVFASRRLVIVKAADRLPAKQCEALLPYLKDPNESTTMVFVAAKLDGRLKFTQALIQASVVVDCAPLKDSQLVPWCKQEASRSGVRIEEAALYLLKEACGGSLYSVRREMEKLASYVSGDRAVTAADVATLRGTEPGASVFDLAAAIGARLRGKALGHCGPQSRGWRSAAENFRLTGLAISPTVEGQGADAAGWTRRGSGQDVADGPLQSSHLHWAVLRDASARGIAGIPGHRWEIEGRECRQARDAARSPYSASLQPPAIRLTKDRTDFSRTGRGTANEILIECSDG